MTKLWHKYALALFLAATLPLGVAVWQIAKIGAGEVNENAKRYFTAVGDIVIGRVRTFVDGASSEAAAIGATIGLAGVPADERLRQAQGQLIGAKYLENYTVYNPDGQDIQHMDGANDKAHATGGTIAAPVPLPDDVRTSARETGVAFSDIIHRADGALFLPITVRILKADGSVYAYGWTAVDMTPLSETVNELSIRRFGAPGLVSLLDDRLRLIAASDKAAIGKLFSQTADQLGMSDVSAALRHDRSYTFEYAKESGEGRMGALSTIPDVGWGVVVEQPSEEVFADVARIWQTAAIIGGAFALAALLLGVFAGRRLSAPISALSGAAGKVAAGDFAVRVAVPGKDEVGQLALSFNAMTEQLTATIHQLQVTTAAKERMQTELDIGRNIQMSMVPLVFPAFPERKEFDIHAALRPAFEVGGDFYDFFLTDPDTLCVCIADVSGKGVPAALFMAVTRTLVKAHASAGASSDEILDKVNDDLARDNEACMFVTMFLGLLDLKTGTLAFTNAGHNPSYIKRQSGEMVRLTALHGPVVAAMEDVPYAAGSAKLGAGDTLFLYTDGVNEAMNAKRELFSEERLAKLLASATWTSSDGAVKLVLDDVWRFQGDAEQADDVTVVALRYLGRS